MTRRSQSSNAGNRALVYLAAPLFNDIERAFNLSLAVKLERYVDIFLPQRDGGMLVDLVRKGVPPEEAATTVFRMDIAAMDRASFLIAVLDGAKIDEGVAFEIGYFYASGKPVHGIQTDVRRALPTGNNPMIAVPMQSISNNINSLVENVRTQAEISRRWPNKPKSADIFIALS